MRWRFKTLEQRLEEKYIPEPNSGCWIWLASGTPFGYGQIWIKNRLHFAHVYLYEKMFGPKPQGLELDHLCRIPCCVNPHHLELVTHRENILRGFNPIANNSRKDRCHLGHLFTPENTILRQDRVGRECRLCRRAINKRTYYRRKTRRSHELSIYRS